MIMSIVISEGNVSFNQIKQHTDLNTFIRLLLYNDEYTINNSNNPFYYVRQYVTVIHITKKLFLAVRINFF